MALPSGSSGTFGSTRPAAPRAPPGSRLFWVALVANLLFGASLALAVSPLETVGNVREAWGSIPAGARGAAPALDRAVDHALDMLVEGAVGNDPRLLLEVPLQLSSNVPVDAWNATKDATISWDTYGSHDLTYLVAVSRSPDAAATLVNSPDAHVEGESTVVPLLEGTSYVHVQATYKGDVGPIGTIGPFRIDSSAPTAPSLPDDLRVTQYQFTVAWPVVNDASGVPEYAVEKSIDGVAWLPLRVVSKAEFTERNVVNGLYHYRVRALNGAGLDSAPSAPLRVTVDASGNLAKPTPGAFDHGVKATYDSLLYVWDISDDSKYDTIDDARASLGAERYGHYTSAGWGIEIDDAGLRATVSGEVGGETNTMAIARDLFIWLFDETDYDFQKLEDPTGQAFQKATETLALGKGICGDLTALYVTALRIAGVPARPVHGYLLNDEPDGGSAPTIGGFHMWAEVYVGGPDPVGNGWIPVDVSGVTGDYEPEKLDIYFGLYNPDYLQLGVQEDLGPTSVDEDDDWELKLRAKWNVWATLNWAYSQRPSDTRPAPDVSFDAEEVVTEVDSEDSRLWISDDHRRVISNSDRSPGEGFDRYFPIKSRSVRTIDYGANLAYADDRLTELNLFLKFPDRVAPSQSTIFTSYQRGPSGATFEVTPAGGGAFEEYGNGFLHWTIAE